MKRAFMARNKRDLIALLAVMASERRAKADAGAENCDRLPVSHRALLVVCFDDQECAIDQCMSQERIDVGPGPMDVTAPPATPGANDACRRVNQVLARMGDKWTVLAITSLAQKPRRFNELKRLIGGVSQQMLTRTLKALERDGMVTRQVYPTVPPQVEYG